MHKIMLDDEQRTTLVYLLRTKLKELYTYKAATNSTAQDDLKDKVEDLSHSVLDSVKELVCQPKSKA